jgi:superfamily II DNA/RNA helicase
MDKKQIKPSFKSYFYLQENSIKNKDIIYDLILKLKYENPSEIQIKIIKSLEKEEYKKDKVSCSIIKAETGTGKTLAYLIELLQSIDFSKENEIQGLIITPTRELALQTEEYINFVYPIFARNVKNLFHIGKKQEFKNLLKLLIFAY